MGIKFRRVISVIMIVAILAGLSINSFALTTNSTAPVLAGLDTLDNLNNTYVYSDGMSITNWYENCAIAPYGTEITENGSAAYPYIEYKVNVGNGLKFNTYNQETTKKFTVQESDNGTDWTDVAVINNSTVMTNAAWTQTVYYTSKTTKQFVRIRFPDTKWNGNYYLLDYVEVIDDSKALLSGLDHYFTATAKFSDKIYSCSGNLTTGNMAWNANLYDTVYPDYTKSYYENGVWQNSYIMYKISSGKDFLARVYEYQDSYPTISRTYNWNIQSSDDGITWADLTVTRELKGQLQTFDGVTKRPFEIVNLKVQNVVAKYIRVVYPTNDWTGSVNSVLSGSQESGGLDSISLNADTVALEGIDEFADLSKIYAKSVNVKTDGYDLQNDENVFYFTDINTMQRKPGWVAYKIAKGSSLSFKAQYKHENILDGVNKYVLQSTVDGQTWNDIPLTESNVTYDGVYWNYSEFSANDIDAEYIRIKFPEGFYSWQALIKSVTILKADTGYSINTSATAFRGVDECNNFAKTVGYSSNLAIDPTGFFMPEYTINYFENHRRDEGFVSYKINVGDDVIFGVRNGDKDQSKEWLLEGSADGKNWTAIETQKTVSQNVISDYWVLMTYRADNIAFPYIRIRFPREIFNWRSLLDNVIIDANIEFKPVVNLNAKKFVGTDELDTFDNLAGKSSNAIIEYSVLYQNEKIENYVNYSKMPGFIAYKIQKGSFLKFNTSDAEKQTNFAFTAQGSNDGMNWTDIPLSSEADSIIWGDYWVNKTYVSESIDFDFVRIVFPASSSGWKSKLEKVEVSLKPLTFEPTILPIVKNTPADFGNATPDVNASPLEGIDGLSSLKNIFKVGPNIERNIGALSMSGNITDIKADDVAFVAYEIPFGAKLEIMTALADRGMGNDSNFVVEVSDNGKDWKYVKYSKALDKLVDNFWQYLKLTVDKANGKYVRIRLPKATVDWKIRLIELNVIGGTASDTALTGKVPLNTLSNAYDKSNNVTLFVDSIGGICGSDKVGISSYVIYKVKKDNAFCVQTQDGDLILDADWQIYTSDDGVNWKKANPTLERKPEDIIAKYWVYSKFYIDKLDAEYVKIVFPSIAFSGKDMIIKVVSAETKAKIDLLFSGGYADVIKAPTEIIRKQTVNLYKSPTTFNTGKNNILLFILIPVFVLLILGAVFFVLRFKKSKKNKGQEV